MSTEVEDLRRQVQERDAEIARLRAELGAPDQQQVHPKPEDSDNFTRAKAQIESWPEWKRDFTLTKDSPKPEDE